MFQFFLIDFVYFFFAQMEKVFNNPLLRLCSFRNSLSSDSPFIKSESKFKPNVLLKSSPATSGEVSVNFDRRRIATPIFIDDDDDFDGGEQLVSNDSSSICSNSKHRFVDGYENPKNEDLSMHSCDEAKNHERQQQQVAVASNTIRSNSIDGTLIGAIKKDLSIKEASYKTNIFGGHKNKHPQELLRQRKHKQQKKQQLLERCDDSDVENVKQEGQRQMDFLFKLKDKKTESGLMPIELNCIRGGGAGFNHENLV